LHTPFLREAHAFPAWASPAARTRQRVAQAFHPVAHVRGRHVARAGVVVIYN
jgi:hypothetical protein